MKKWIWKTVALEDNDKNKDLWTHIEHIIKMANELE